MRTLALLERGVRLVVDGRALHVERDGARVQPVQVHQLHEVQVHAGTDLTAAARTLLLREGVDVVFFGGGGRVLGRLHASASRQGTRRLAQYAFAADPTRRLAVARAIVSAKIRGQRLLLVRHQRRSPDEQVGGAATAMRALLPRVEEVGSLDALRGVEGAAASRYFGVFGRLIRNPAFSFTGRTRHPPRDATNACLSFGYGLLRGQVERALHRAGLDPLFGCLHEPGRGAPALAFDLMEEWRPLVDRTVLTLLNRRELGPEDFRIPMPEELGARAELSDEAVYRTSSPAPLT